MKLEITKEKVLEAASRCSQAKETLKTLFPEVFEDGIEFTDFTVSHNVESHVWIANGFAPKGLEGKCLGLNEDYEWTLIKENRIQFIVPKRK